MMRLQATFAGISLLLLLLLLLTACGEKSQAENAETKAPAEKVTVVVVEPVVLADLQETFTLPGSLEAWEDLTLAAEVAGPVRWIGVREGDRVRRGEPLLRIDPETAEANLARARAEFAVREKQLQRLEKLLEQKFVSQQEYDEARKAFDIAHADLARARLALEKSTLLSPVDGVVDLLLIDRGEYVAEGAPVAVLVQVDRLKALVEVPEKDVSWLRSGQTVDVLPAAIAGPAGKVREGKILHLAYKADPLTRTYLAKIEVRNPAGDLRPGMILRARFLRRELTQAIAIPLYAVVERGGERIVFVEVQGIAQRRPVRTGAVLGDRVVIEEGLRPGDRLLVQGQQLVTDGTKITESVATPTGGAKEPKSKS
ncbi:MAG: efflux RND transporter periplasmic adaptor subunit [Desulfuromonadales bacterium]